MLAFFRTYRLIPAFLAGVLLVSGSAPLIRHACAAIGQTWSLPDTCCCSHTTKSGSDTQSHHSPDTRCNENYVSPVNKGFTEVYFEKAVCCTIEIHTAGVGEMIKDERMQHVLLTPVLVPTTEFYLPTPESFSPPFFPEHGPPASTPYALHLYFGSFLN